MKLTCRGVFERVKSHLLAQKDRCESVGRCFLRRGDLRDAIGCLIDDAHYSGDDLEDCEVPESPEVRRAIAGSLGGDDLTREAVVLLSMLREVHDEWPVEAWPKALEKIIVPDAPELKVLSLCRGNYDR